MASPKVVRRRLAVAAVVLCAAAAATVLTLRGEGTPRQVRFEALQAAQRGLPDVMAGRAEVGRTGGRRTPGGDHDRWRVSCAQRASLRWDCSVEWRQADRTYADAPADYCRRYAMTVVMRPGLGSGDVEALTSDDGAC